METLPDWDLLAVVRNCCSTTTTTTTFTATPTISTADLGPSPPQLSPLQEPCLTTGAFFQFASSGQHELQDVCKPLICTTASTSTAAVSSAVSTTAAVMQNNNNRFQCSASLASPVSSPSSVISGGKFCVSQQQPNISQQQVQFQQQYSIVQQSQVQKQQQQQQPSISQQTEFQQQTNISQQQTQFQQQPNIFQQSQIQQQPSISQQQMEFRPQPNILQQSQVQQQPPSISQQTEFQQSSIFQQMQIHQQQPIISQQTQFRGLVKPSQVIFGASSTSISGSGGTSHVQRTKKRKNVMKKVCHVPAEGLSSDMWAWRKYGQKPIKGSPYPRGYYRCSSSKGCLARKQVERNRSDPKMFIVTYTSEHNHPMPTHRNSLAGSTRQKPLSSTETPPQDQPSCSSPSAASLSPLTEKSESKTEGDDLIKEEDDTTDMALSDLMLNDDFYVGFEQIDGGSDGSDCFSDQFSPSSEFPWLASSSATTPAGGS